jgi:hypothetical protein
MYRIYYAGKMYNEKQVERKREPFKTTEQKCLIHIHFCLIFKKKIIIHNLKGLKCEFINNCRPV